MKNKKGFTLLEIIVSVGLIAVVMLFLFQLLTDVSFEAEHPTYAKENQVIRASVMRKIQQDFISMPLVDVNMQNEHTIRFLFKNGVDTIYKELNLSETDINYDNESWSVKGNEVKIDFEHISIVKNSASESDLCREETNPDLNITEEHCPTYKSIKIKIPIINESEDNIIDDIELFYIGENTIFVPDYSARTYYLTLDAKTGTNIAVNRTRTDHEDVAPLVDIKSGAAIYPGDQLTIVTNAKEHYELTDVKVEGYEGFSKDNPSGSISVKGNVKVTANAKLKEYKLTLDARTGSEIIVVRDSSLSGVASGRISNGATIYDGDRLTIYANPTNTSQYNQPTIKVNNANFAPATSYEVRGDTIVLAQTTPREYTLTKSQGTGTTLKITRTRSTIGNGATNTTLENNATIYCDDLLEITADTTTGYKNAKITVNGETLSSNETKLVTGNTTISSSASPETYTISYNANGGSGAPANQTKTYNQELTLSSTEPTRSGHTFLGWAESSSAAAAAYQAGGKYTKNSATTLYAVWKVSNYTITFNANGGTGSMENQEVSSGSTVNLNANKFTHSSKVFGGWATSATGNAVYNDKDPITVTANMTLYAVWKDSMMYKNGKDLIIESKYYIPNARYTTFNGGGCGDHHESYMAKIGIIFGGYTADWHSLNSDYRHYVVAGDKYLWTSKGHSSKRLDATYYMLGTTYKPDRTNISFEANGSGYMSNSGNTAVKYCEGINIDTCHQVADKFSYSYTLQEVKCNHYDLSSTTPRYCDLSISFKGTFTNYVTDSGYPTGIGLHLDEWAEEGGGEGSSGGSSACCVEKAIHRNLNF